MDINTRFATTGTLLRKRILFLKHWSQRNNWKTPFNWKEALKEIEVLKSFKAFLNTPCEICKEPVKEWDDYNVKLAIQGIGRGHTQCWNSELGRFIELRKAIEKVKKT